MEFSDNEEDINNINDNKNKEKNTEKKEQSISKLSLEWLRESISSISQITKSEQEEMDEIEKIEKQNDNIQDTHTDTSSDSDNADKNKENISNHNNSHHNEKDNNNKDNEAYIDTNNTNNKKNYTFIWDGEGDNVKLIGSFSNWKEQYEMEKDEKNKIYKISLLLDNDIYEYKYIVDGVWKCSKNQEIIDDGKGNINNILDLTNNKTKQKINYKNKSKKNIKNENNIIIKEINEINENIYNNNEKKENIKNNIFGNIYPDYITLNKPFNSHHFKKVFNINNESKQKKIGIEKYYQFKLNNSYSSNKSYLNIPSYKNTILNHIIFQKKLKKNINIKIGLSHRYRGKETTFIYYNYFSKYKN